MSSQLSVQERAQGRKEGKTGSSCVSGGARSQYSSGNYQCSRPDHRRAVKSTKGPVDVYRKLSEKAERALTVALLGVLWGRGLTPAGLQLQSTLKQGLSKFSQAGLELVNSLP